MSLQENTIILAALVLMYFNSGCATGTTSDTKRTGKEQLLLSNAIDQSLDKIDFQSFAGSKIFLNEKYLDSVDSKYIVGSVRHRVLISDAILVDKADKADYILEVRSGGVGTDNRDTFVGMPKLEVPGPIPVSMPEIRLWSRTRQTGLAKIGIVAIDAKSNRILGNGGTTLAKSDDTTTYVFGVGPWHSGTIKEEVKFAKTQHATAKPLATQISFVPNANSMPTSGLARRRLPQERTSRIRLASQEEEEQKKKKKPLSNPFASPVDWRR